MAVQSFFWHDQWCDDAPMRELLPALFVLAMDRDAFVDDYGASI